MNERDFKQRVLDSMRANDELSLTAIAEEASLVESTLARAAKEYLYRKAVFMDALNDVLEGA